MTISDIVCGHVVFFRILHFRFLVSQIVDVPIARDAVISVMLLLNELTNGERISTNISRLFSNVLTYCCAI